jgi:AcrR family transcriptional regulator
MEQVTAHHAGRGRRPEAVVRDQALSAAGALLLLDGLTGFTLEKVAALSGVSRVTLNKYWPSRGALALDGYLHQTRDRLAFRDTGDLGADLVHAISAWARHLADAAQRRIFTQLIGAAQSDPELAAAFDSHYFGPRREEALHLLGLAIRRQQVRAAIDAATVVDMLWGACHHRLLMPNLAGTLTPDFIRTLVRTTLQGIVPAAAPANPRHSARSQA